MGDKRQSEALEHKAKEDEMRNAVLIEKQRRDQLQRMADAVLFLQGEGRQYIERIMERRKASKKGGKKKEGREEEGLIRPGARALRLLLGHSLPSHSDTLGVVRGASLSEARCKACSG